MQQAENKLTAHGRLVYAALCATTFMVGVVMITVGPLLESIMHDMGLSLTQGGLVSVAFALGMLVGVVCLNFLLAGIPVKWGLVGASVLQGIGLTLAGFVAQSLVSLFLFYWLVGFGCVFLNSLPGMWVTSTIKEQTDRAMVALLFFFASGMTVTPLAIGLLQRAATSWRWVFVGEGILSFFLAGFLATQPIEDIKSRENLRGRQISEVVSYSPVLFVLIVASALFYIGAEFDVNVWLAKFEMDIFGLAKSTASWFVTVFWVGMVFGRVLVLFLTRKFGAATLLASGMFLMAAAVGLLVVVPNAAASAVCVFLAGLGASGAFPLILSFAGKFPGWHAGVVYSAVILAGAIGRIIFPYLFGPLAQAAGFRLAMGMAALLALGVVAGALGIRRTDRTVRSEL